MSGSGHGGRLAGRKGAVRSIGAESAQALRYHPAAPIVPNHTTVGGPLDTRAVGTATIRME